MKKKDLLILWTESQEFLSTYTTADIRYPRDIKLQINLDFDINKLDSNLKEIIASSGKPYCNSLWNVWTIPSEKLESAIISLYNIQDILPLRSNAVELQIRYYFKFIDRISRLQLPNYEFDGYVQFIFSKKHSCCPSLIFPFEEADSDFWEYWDEISLSSPFELDEKILRKMYVKDGRPSIMRKIKRPL